MQSYLSQEVLNVNNLDPFIRDENENHDDLETPDYLNFDINYTRNKDFNCNFNNLLTAYRHNHNEFTIELLIKMNMGLVRKIALKYLNYLGNTHSFEDLVSEGILGLIKAVEKFNSSSGYDFLTYASYWIRLVIARSIIDTGTMIRVPVHLVELIIKINKIEHSYRLAGRDVDFSTICRRLQITPEKYQEAKLIEYRYFNLIDFDIRPKADSEDFKDFELEESDRLTELYELDDFINPESFAAYQSFGEELSDPAVIFEEIDFKVFIRKTITTLSERECNIIKLRFGFNDGKTKTLQEVAEIYGLTRERVRQIEIKALQKLMFKLFKIKKYWTA